MWRLQAEAALIDRFYRERAPEAELYRLDAQLKLLGHGGECLTPASGRKLVRLTRAQQDVGRAAAVTVRRVIARLRSEDLLVVRSRNRHLYTPLIGDTCHARHGLAGT